MGDKARRYWSVLAAGDKETSRAIATEVVARLRAQAEEHAHHGECLPSTGLRLGASAIERGDLAPYPRPD